MDNGKKEVWHVLLWGRSMIYSHFIREGDIVDIIPAKQWDLEDNEARLCLILPVTGLHKKQADILKEPGKFLKRKYRIAIDDLKREYNLNESKVRDEWWVYQPFLDKGIVVDLAASRLVTDKQNNVVDMSSIELRI